MNKFVLFIHILFLSNTIYSQSIIIGDSVQLKRGIYSNFNEFKYNCPSIEFNYQINQDIQSTDIGTNKKIVSYTLNIGYQKANELGSIFGFCDGKDVYVSEKTNTFDNNTKFLKLHNLGRYCYFEELVGSSVNMGNSIIPSYDFLQLVIDIVSGKEIVLSKNKVKQLIQSDSLLLAEFNFYYPNIIKETFQPRKRINLIKEYIIRFSEIHKNDTAFLKILSLEEIEQNLNKNDSEASDVYYKRILNFSSNPYFDELELYHTKYRNGNTKYIGILAKYQLDLDQYSLYKIGTWSEFYKNGKLKCVIDYNLNQQLNGRYQVFNKEGELIENKKFVKDIEQNYFK